MKSQLSWYNYKTQDYEYLDAPLNDEKALELLPQHPSAQALYSIYREHKDASVLEAMLEVLTACMGERNENS